MLLIFGADKQPDFKEERISVVSLEATAISEEASEPGSAERERTKEQPVPPQPAPEEPLPSEPPPAAEPKAAPTMQPPDEPPPSPAITRNAVRPSGRPARSEEPRVGKEGVSKGRYRWVSDPSKKKK